MTNDLYHETILEELHAPQNNGELANHDVTLSETNASCGDAVTVFLKFDGSGQKIQKISWQGMGCAISQAAMSLLSQKVIEMENSAVLQLERKDMEALLGLEQPITYGRVKCLLLGLNAVKTAINQHFNR
jgi:nitrogen fixation NifU-like protein